MKLQTSSVSSLTEDSDLTRLTDRSVWLKNLLCLKALKLHCKLCVILVNLKIKKTSFAQKTAFSVFSAILQIFLLKSKILL